MVQGEKQKNKIKNDPELETSENNIFESGAQDNNGLKFGNFEKSSKSTYTEGSEEHEIVAPEVREDTNIGNSIKTAQKESEQWAEAEREVELWQSQNGIKLRQGAKEIACLAAYIHNTEKRGLIRTDLEKQGHTPNYARRILYRFQEKNVLRPIDGRRRIGRLQEYFLTTEIDKYINNMDDNDKTAKYNVKQREKEEEESLSFIQYLISYLSAQRPTFHKLVLQTQILKDYYNILGHHWNVKDASNKTKITDYNLGFRRSAIVKVSPNGTVMIHLESTNNPYRLHKPEGLVDFFGACGTILSRLEIECNDKSRGIRPISEWYLKQHDFDKTIPISALEEKIPHIRRWWSREGIQLKYLGKLFQIYGKAMPIDGKTIRFEGSISTKENIQIAQGITEAIQPELKYETAFELYKQQNRSQMELIQERLKKLEERIS